MARGTLIRLVAAGFGVLALAFAVTFMQGFLPAPAAPEPRQLILIDSIAPDSHLELEWQGRPVVIYRPGVEAARALLAANARTGSVQFEAGSLPPAFVYYRGAAAPECVPQARARGALGADWPGGWVDPCRPGAWDVAGRGLHGFGGAEARPDLTAPTHRIRDAGQTVELR